MCGYFEKLAMRTMTAWTNLPCPSEREVESLLKEVNANFIPLIVPPDNLQPVKKLSAAEKRDFWQSQIVQALVPPTEKQAFDLREQGKTLAKVAARLSQLLKSRQNELENHFGKSLPHLNDRLTEKGWTAFIDQELTNVRKNDAEQELLPSAQPTLKRLAEISGLIKSAVPVVARRLAAELTQKERVGEVFVKYGFVAPVENAEAELVQCLKGEVLPEKVNATRFKRWPLAAVSGSFAKDLAAELDYTPSSWALEGELQCIEDRRRDPTRETEQEDLPNSSNENNPLVSPKDRAWNANLLGLAFSGGGIRSATFNLGILQGLAKLNMLKRLDYLSTVSGGGYIGSWLLNWIRQTGLGNVARRLCPEATADPTDARVAPIRFLRDFSNYLTPRLGLLSADLWVLAVVWFRNTVLNLTVLLPAIIAVLLAPRLAQLWMHYIQVTGTSQPGLPPTFLSYLYLPTFLAFAGCAGFFLSLNLWEFRASQGDVEPGETRNRHFYVRPRGVQLLILLPTFVSAWIASIELWRNAGGSGLRFWWILFFAASAFVFMILFGARYPTTFRTLHESAWRNIAEILMLLIALALGGVTTLIVSGLKSIFALWPFDHNSSHDLGAAAPVTTFGVPLIIFALFFVLILMVGLMGRNFADAASRWLVRVRAYMAIYSTLWVAWVGIALYGHAIVLKLWSWPFTKWPAIATWAWTTLRGVLAGKDPRTAGGKSDWKTSLGFYATVGPYVFIVGLLLYLSFVSESAFTAMKGYLSQSSSSFCGVHWLLAQAQSHPTFSAVAICFIIASSLAAIMSACVDVNEFSLNSFYRGRLVRAYLGAANTNRHPNPFTGFDPEDDCWPLATFKENIPKQVLRDLKRSADAPTEEKTRDDRRYGGPFPIYNATVNLVHGDELAWQERKGASFVFTPQVCGYETPWNADSNPHAFRHLDYLGYRETSSYAYSPLGVHLGTPMTISGAALSPNMGSYTRAATGFLMTVFNARLGWWLGNPRHKTTWRKASPTQGLVYLMKELLGLTNDRAGFVYVSDGGHFENLGIYELIRRRCRFIIACDAEEDAGFAFNGLGNAIRKCREDFGVEINTHVDLIHPDAATKLSRNHCVVGTIQYPDQAGFGYLVYIKASIVGDEPEDVLQYRVKCPAFPHQSTGDQWFTESQFESYRRLGLHIAETTFQLAIGDLKSKASTPTYTEELFEHLQDHWYPPNKAIQKNFTRHAEALDALVREMRSDDILMKLDAVLVPLQIQAKVEIPNKDMPKVLLFLSSVIQLMENIYIDLDLENNADHPHNAGWIQIFQAWAQTEIFQEAWNRYGWSYGRNFQRFCARRFSLPEA
jgi:hypothetical protein